MNNQAVTRELVAVARLIAADDVLAWNTTSFSWEDDALSRRAEIVRDGMKLKLVIRETKDKYGIGKGHWEQVLEDKEIGTLEKPRLGEVASLLKKYSLGNSRSSSGFKQKWEGAAGKDSLMNILVKERGFAKYSPDSMPGHAPAAPMEPEKSKFDFRGWEQSFTGHRKSLADLAEKVDTVLNIATYKMDEIKPNDLQRLLGHLNSVAGQLANQAKVIGDLADRASREATEK
jgi:hypothetical protein